MIDELLAEYSLEIDDVRWYLSSLMADQLLSYTKNKKELQELIWSGDLEAQLYNMEESYLSSLKDEFERDVLDEANIRDFLAEMAAMKALRHT